MCAQDLSSCPVGVRSCAAFNTSRESGTRPHYIDYLWGHRAHYQWRQRWCTGNSDLCLQTWRTVTKYCGPQRLKALKLLSKLTEHHWWAACIRIYTNCFCWKGALAHKCIDMHGSCLLSIWVRNQWRYQAGNSRTAKRKKRKRKI